MEMRIVILLCSIKQIRINYTELRKVRYKKWRRKETEYEIMVMFFLTYWKLYL